MATGVVTWSQTAGSNATSDSAVNWQEGQAPSSVNDSARAMMASTAKWRDDMSGIIVSAGTSTAYTVTSNQQFASLAAMDKAVIAFTPHATCGASPTLSVDGLSGQPIKSATGVLLAAGVLVVGTPYTLLYSNADNSFYTRDFFGNPYNVPIGASMDYWGSAAPNSSFAFMTGSAISRTTYSTLFSLIGTLYGAGDGSTTFNMPDKRGRVSVSADGGTGRITGSVFSTLVAGGVGGAQTQTLNTSNLPPYTPSGTVSTSVASSATQIQSTANGGANAFATNSVSGGTANMAGILGIAINSSFSGNAQGGSSVPVVTMPPAIVCNSIMRII